ncbi:MAG: hypothetical protein R2728_03925 [Chitinophagales bacterium]
MFLFTLIVSFTALQFSSTIVEGITKPLVELVSFESNSDTENKESTEVFPSDEILTHQKNKYPFKSQLDIIENPLFAYISYFTPIESPPPKV